MCNYNQESKKAVRALPVPVSEVRRVVGSRAQRALVHAVRNSRAFPGHDLFDGTALPPGSLARGHYMSPQNFQRALDRMDRQPYRCQWCGGRLPLALVSRHLRPHNHRDEIVHHFHRQCWTARLLALAVIFGHLPAKAILVGERRRRRLPVVTVCESAALVVTRQYQIALPRKTRGGR